MSARLRWLEIETPEGVRFSYELATPAVRALAWCVDGAAIGAASIAAAKAAEALDFISRDVAKGIGILAYFAISIAYGIVLEWRWRGQTVGKRLFGLRVIDVQGLRLQLPQIVVRNLLRFVDALPVLYLAGGVAAFLSARGQRLGDLAANTVVARERRASEPDLEEIAPARYNSLAAWPNLAARLRARARPETVGLAVRAVAQRDGYRPVERVALFAELGAHFRSLVPFPEEAVETLTDEQFVRSALRVIFRPATGRERITT